MKKFLILLVPIAALCYWLYKIEFFEQKAPQIRLVVNANKEQKYIENDGKLDKFWNLKQNLELEISDTSGIKSYGIVMRRENGEILFEREEIITYRPKILKAQLPKPNISLRDNDKIIYEITARDFSRSNLFRGNTQRATFVFTIDRKAPLIHMLATSYRIAYGGSALLIFRIDDLSTERVVVTNGTDEFMTFPFIKPGNYAVIIAWPIKNKNFNGMIYAIDKANNVKKVGIPIVKAANIYYRYAELKLKDDFLNTKPDALINAIGERKSETFGSAIEKFKYINEDIRAKDENLIVRTTRQIDLSLVKNSPVFHSFLPLKRSQVVGTFGDHRTYTYHDKKISQSIHLGLDMANYRNAPIFVSNPGRVIFADLLGVYGNTMILDHGMGISSLYSHASKLSFKVGDSVKIGDELGLTGQTGWSFGDHLHLGILVQGHEVRVKEWMDPRWIKNNINDVFLRAQKQILDAQ